MQPNLQQMYQESYLYRNLKIRMINVKIAVTEFANIIAKLFK